MALFNSVKYLTVVVQTVALTNNKSNKQKAFEEIYFFF